MFSGRGIGAGAWLSVALVVGVATAGCGSSSGSGDAAGDGAAPVVEVAKSDADAGDAAGDGAAPVEVAKPDGDAGDATGDGGDSDGSDSRGDAEAGSLADAAAEAAAVDADAEAAEAGAAADADADDASSDGGAVIEDGGLPLPEGVPPPRRLFDDKATLTGGRSIGSCSHQEPPSGDGHRWCAFSITGATPPATELWVIDATRAAAGDVPTCDGSNAGCQRLTTNLWTEFPLIGPGHPYAHSFDGDTLIFYADATSGKDQVHRGPVYAWRPGWAAARQLSSEKGLLCSGDKQNPVAVCWDDLQGDPVKPDSVELRAGRLTDGATGLLPSLGRLNPAFGDGIPSWHAEFSPAGDLFAFSGAFPGEPATEILRVVPTDGLGTAQPNLIVTDASSWVLSHDGKKVYFYQEIAGELHTLCVADFPSGMNVRTLATRVHDYAIVGDGPADQGVVYIHQTNDLIGEFALVLLRDSAAPETGHTVFSYHGFLEGVEISRDLTYTTWLDSGFTASVVRNDTLATCVLNTHDQAAFEIQILASVGLAFWTEDATDGSFGRDAFFTTPAACAPKQRFARGVYWYTPVGDRGLVFGDEYGSFERTVTMKYASVTHADAAWQLNPAVRVDDKADPEFVLLGETAPLLLYVKQHGDAATVGTYVFGPVPF